MCGILKQIYSFVLHGCVCMSVSEDGSVCSPESTIWAKAILLSPGMALRRRHINEVILLPFWNSKDLALHFF